MEAAARRLLNIDQHFSQGFPEAPFAGYEIDAEGTLVHVNAAACKLLGRRAAEMAGRPIWDFVPLEARGFCHLEVMRRLRGEQAFEPYEQTYEREGGLVTAEVREMPVFDDRRRLVGTRCFMADRTAHRSREEALRREADKLARQNAGLEQFAWTVAHDLHEPLRAVAGNLRLLDELRQGKSGSRADEALRMAERGAARMQELIDGILSYSLAGAAGPSRQCDASEALGGALANLRAAIEESGAEIRHGSLPTVPAGPVELLQVFQNLIGNAIKFRSAGSPAVEVSCEEAGGAWLFGVRDNGIGIDPADADLVFEPFRRLRGTRSGAGAGLAICKRIVERRGGKIWVAPAADGAIFYFTVPKRSP